MCADKNHLLQELESRKQQVLAYLNQPQFATRFQPEQIHAAVYSYINMGGKSLRPAITMLSCGAMGADEQLALPAAAATEVFHTWTLVHDDIMDRDDKRRGAPTVHARYTATALHELGYTRPEAEQYGLSVGILTGDAQQAWSILLFTELLKNQINAELIVSLIAEICGQTALVLTTGQMLDVLYAKEPITNMGEAQIIEMLWKKTGALYEFAGRAGAAIGYGDSTLRAAPVEAIAQFCSRCGTAFQLQDDILGIMGDEARLGKPIGSDIREGKRTLIVLHAFQNASEAQRAQLASVLGNPHATPPEVKATIALLCDLGGVEYTQRLANRYITEALAYLAPIPDSSYKNVLLDLAHYMIEREL